MSQVDFLFPSVFLLHQTLGFWGLYLRPRGSGAAGGTEPASPSVAHAPPGGFRVPCLRGWLRHALRSCRSVHWRLCVGATVPLSSCWAN